MPRTALVLCLALALTACGRADAPAAAPASLETASPALAQDPAHEPHSAQEEILLDRRADGAALHGRLMPVPEDSDADRVLTLRTSGLDGALGSALEGASVLDARFVDGGLVVLRADHTLVAHQDGGTIELDTQVEGPLTVAGTRVAYVRGEMPELELAVADARSGNTRPLTQGMAPAWSPALSPDGSEIVFVSGVGGSPLLYRVSTRGGAPVALPPSERFPTAPVAPRWTADGTLHFEDEQGPATLLIPGGDIGGEVR